MLQAREIIELDSPANGKSGASTFRRPLHGDARAPEAPYGRNFALGAFTQQTSAESDAGQCLGEESMSSTLVSNRFSFPPASQFSEQLRRCPCSPASRARAIRACSIVDLAVEIIPPQGIHVGRRGGLRGR